MQKKHIKNAEKSELLLTDRPTDRPTERVIKSRARDKKENVFFLIVENLFGGNEERVLLSHETCPLILAI